MDYWMWLTDKCYIMLFSGKLTPFLLDRLGRQLKLFMNICRSFLSRVRIAVWPSNIFVGEKHPKTIAKTEFPFKCSVEWTSDPSKEGNNCVHGWSPVTRRKVAVTAPCSQGWSPVTRRNGDNLNCDNCCYCGDSLRQNSMPVASFPYWQSC